jgi:hypothetical protein
MNYKLSDSVLHRIVQIVQEGFLLGIDVADLMRQIVLTQDQSDPDMLVLEPDYKKSIEEAHQKYLKDLEAKMTATKGLDTQVKLFD